MAAAEMADFDSVFPRLVDDLVSGGMADKEVGDAAAWYREVLEYNCPHGKKNRGLTVVDAYRHLAGDAAVNEDDLLIARVLGWCVEMVSVSSVLLYRYHLTFLSISFLLYLFSSTIRFSTNFLSFFSYPLYSLLLYIFSILFY